MSTSTPIEPDDPRYPASMRDLFSAEGRPLPTLWVRGDFQASSCAPNRDGIAIVGTRHPSSEAVLFTRRLARSLASLGYPIWSGGALGIDAAAHAGALDEGCPTVAVLGGGLDVPYPREHIELFHHIVERGGALVARVPDHSPPTPLGFLQRNRVLAACTQAMVMVQGGLKSGARSAVSAAYAYARVVGVVPHAPWDELGAGCALELVRGAMPMTRVEDLLAALKARDASLPIGAAALSVPALPRRVPQKSARRSASKPSRASQLSLPVKPDLAPAPSVASARTPSEAAVLALLGPADVVHADDLCERSGLPFRVVASLLTGLTLDGTLVEAPPGFFRRGALH